MTRTMIRGLLTSTALIAVAGTARAQSTSAGYQVSNSATASYTVNGTAQTATSNTATFVVDRKVNLTLIADQTGDTAVNIGQTGVVTRFKLTNNTNAVQDFILDVDQNVVTGILAGTDDFDLSNLKVYVDSNNNGTYDPGVDTQGYVDELPQDGSVEIFVVGDVPATTTINRAFVSLRATVAAGGTPGTQGAALIPTDLNVVNQDNVVDTVFADNDSDGTLGPDLARNGQARAYATYEVSARNVALTIVKTQRIVSDGVNAINPKALPGAVVEYCLTVQNGTVGVPATGVTLTDIVPANTSYVPGSIAVGGIGTGGVCLVSGFPQNDDGSNTVGPYRGQYDTATRKVTATIPTLPGATSIAASFRVTIN